MANVHIQEDFYVPSTDVVVDYAGDIVDIMESNDITATEILSHLDWGRKELEQAAQDLMVEYRPVCTTGASLLSLFRKMEVTEQREFLSMITDSIISYYKSDLTIAWPSDL